MPRALSGRPEAEIGSGLAPALCVRCYRRKRAQGGAMGHNDKSLTGEVIPDRIAVIQAFLQAADPYLRFSRVSGSRGKSREDFLRGRDHESGLGADSRSLLAAVEPHKAT